jgi:hypothetical protein
MNGLCVVCGTNHHKCQDHPFQETVFSSPSTFRNLTEQQQKIEDAAGMAIDWSMVNVAVFYETSSQVTGGLLRGPEKDAQ